MSACGKRIIPGRSLLLFNYSRTRFSLTLVLLSNLLRSPSFLFASFFFSLLFPSPSFTLFYVTPSRR